MTEMDGGIDGIEPEIEGGEPGDEVDRDARIGGEKAAEARRQPARAEGRQNGEVQRTAMRVGAQVQRGAGDTAQRLADLARIGVAGKRQAHGLAFAQEKLDAELLLQRLDLAADGALRQVEFARRLP